MKQKILSVTAKDCDFEFYRGSGDGGQKKQKTSSACRCRHLASGAVGKSEDFREQHKNKQMAFMRMAETEVFKKWLNLQLMKQLGKLDDIEKIVNESMKKIKIEIKDDEGRWVEVNEYFAARSK